MKHKNEFNSEPCKIHDHFSGSANCVECNGPCELHGPELIATELARWICERAAIHGHTTLSSMETSTLRKAGVDPVAFMRRAVEEDRPRKR